MLTVYQHPTKLKWEYDPEMMSFTTDGEHQNSVNIFMRGLPPDLVSRLREVITKYGPAPEPTPVGPEDAVNWDF